MPKIEVAAVAQTASTAQFPRLAYGIEDAAEALDLSRSRIYELIADGEIAVCKIGKRTIIPTTELTAFLERHRVEGLTGLGAPSLQRQKRNGGRPAS